MEILSRIGRGERIDHFETIRLAKDGRELNVSITVSPIKDGSDMWLALRRWRETSWIRKKRRQL